MDNYWLRDRLEELAKEVGTASWRLRAHGLDWQAERLQARVEVLLNAVTPTVAELIQDGLAEDAAHRVRGEEKTRYDRLLGVRPS